MAHRSVLALALLGASCSNETSTVGADAGPAMRISRAEPAAEMPAPERTDPDALAELLAAAPSSHPAPTGPDGGTLIGSATGLDADGGGAAPATSSSASPNGAVHAYGLRIQPLLSSPAIERAAREQIYWQLMRKCALPGDKLPPPESITLVFTVRADGAVDPASVGATAKVKALEPIAECVVHEFSASPFVGPAETRGSSARVEVTWPSVD